MKTLLKVDENANSWPAEAIKIPTLNFNIYQKFKLDN